MKKNFLSIALAGGLLVLSLNASAQKDSSGIYKTVADFQQRKLSYAINYKTEKHTINDNLLFNDADIRVKHHGETFTLLKSETYGFRNMEGEEFRFADNKQYKIFNPGEPLLIYVYQHQTHSPKEAEKYSPTYFFSMDASSALQSLTKTNLKAAFPNNNKFHNALDEQFKKDDELTAYDSFHKMYKLCRIYETSIK